MTDRIGYTAALLRGASNFGLVSLVFVLSSGVANGQADSTLPGPALDRPELPCGDYGLNEFVSDTKVTQKFLPPDKEVRKTLPPPCAEGVTPAVADVKSGEASRNVSALGSLFDNSRTALERLQNGFDLYSWLTFIALNSPEDPSVPFGLPSAPTVWEREFRSLNQVIPQGMGLPAVCAGLPKQTPKPTLFVEVDDVAFDQPFKSGPLVDQDGHYSLNTIFMNATMQKYIADNHLDNATGQNDFERDNLKQSRINFPVGDADQAALGAVMIKASWKLMTASDNRSEFHTALAYRFFPAQGEGPGAKAASCDIVALGLVGLHIVHKTKGRRQWIWTTFEHVRNVPSADEIKSGAAHGKSYLFYREQQLPVKGAHADKTAPGSVPANANRTPPQPWLAERPPIVKSQIVRARAITDDAQTINRQARDYLTHLAQTAPGSFAKEMVWQNYQLVSTQWPAAFACAGEANAETNQQTDPNCSPAPEFLPNSTLETYVQHDIGTPGGMPQSTSSCIACHNNAVAYLKIEYDKPERTSTCKNAKPTDKCSPASDLTFILEQVCAPLPDPLTHSPIAAACKHELADDRIAGAPTKKGDKP
jgi:hypothetical protein